MKTACILALLAIASPALAQTPAPKPVPAQDQKPSIFDYDGPGLKSFVPPTPVTVGPPGEAEIYTPSRQATAPASPDAGKPGRIELRRVMPLPPEPAPQPPKTSLG